MQKQTEDDHHIGGVINPMLYVDQAFCALTGGAKRLFVCMAVESRECKPFSFSKGFAERKYHIPNTSFERHTRELVSAGAIVLLTNQADRVGKTGCMSNIWRITPNWWQKVDLGDGEKMASINLTQEQVAAINAALEKNYRVELIPLKDGVKIVKVSRAEIKAK